MSATSSSANLMKYVDSSANGVSKVRNNTVLVKIDAVARFSCEAGYRQYDSQLFSILLASPLQELFNAWREVQKKRFGYNFCANDLIFRYRDYVLDARMKVAAVGLEPLVRGSEGPPIYVEVVDEMKPPLEVKSKKRARVKKEQLQQDEEEDGRGFDEKQKESEESFETCSDEQVSKQENVSCSNNEGKNGEKKSCEGNQLEEEGGAIREEKEEEVKEEGGAIQEEKEQEVKEEDDDDGVVREEKNEVLLCMSELNSNITSPEASSESVSMSSEIDVKISDKMVVITTKRPRKEINQEENIKQEIKEKKVAPRKKKKATTNINSENLNLKIQVIEKNPKKAGSGSHIRYEKYKAAKTKGEYFAFGGTKGDYKHDLERGFVIELLEACDEVSPSLPACVNGSETPPLEIPEVNIACP